MSGDPFVEKMVLVISLTEELFSLFRPLFK